MNFIQIFAAIMRSNRILFFPLIIILLFTGFIQAQRNNNGIPCIINYSSEDFNAIEQNWTVLQDRRGVMYFGNTNGILTFNGNSWQTIYPSRYMGIVRSLAINQKGIIYAGSINSFGYLASTKDGTIAYHTLNHLVPQGRESFNDIWHIACQGEFVFFMARQTIFIFRNNVLFKVLDAQKKFTFITRINGKIYIHDSGSGLQVWENGVMHPLSGEKFFRDQNLVFLLPFENNSLLIGTMGHGIFLFQHGKVTSWGPFSSNKNLALNISCGIELFDHTFAVGTTQSGLFFLNRNGKITGSLGIHEGIIGNEITHLFSDRDANLWVTTSYGISFVEVNAPFTYYHEPFGLKRKTILGSIFFQNNIFLAGSDAVYYLPPPGSVNDTAPCQIKELGKSAGQSWQLKRDNQNLYIAHNPGIIISGKDHKQSHLLKESNVYNICLPTGASDKLLATVDHGVVVIEKNRSSIKEILSLKESPRYMEQDASGMLWIIPETLNGIYGVTLNQRSDSVLSCNYYNTYNGLPDYPVLSIVPSGNRLWVLTEVGLYQYHPENDKFEYDSTMNRFPVKGAFIANSDEDGNIWLGGMSYLTLLKRNKTGNYSSVDTVFRRLLGHSVFHSAKMPDNTWIFSGNHGVIRYNPAIRFTPEHFNTLIYSVSSISKDSNRYHHDAFPHNAMVFGSSQGKAEVPEIQYHSNSLRFVCASGCFIEPQKVMFRYSLDQHENGATAWSDWSTGYVKEYTNLSEGNYIFRVMSKNVYGIEGKEATFRFTILPPWYRRIWVYCIYFILAVLLIMVIINLNARRLKSRNLHLEQNVQERTREILFQKEEIEEQKRKIEEQHKKILNDRDNLEAMAIQLKDLDAFKSRFFANISHELKTPLTLIISPLEQLEQNTNDDRLKQYYAVMLRNARRLLNLINQLLDLSKLEKGVVQLNLEWSEINGFIRNVVDGFSQYAKEKKINLMYTEVSESIWLYFDKDILEKILDNLLSNALKFTHEGGAITVRLSLTQNGEWISLMVKDTGEGIPGEHLDKIFDRFYQAEFPGGRDKDGFGIGLSFVKELTEIHHGNISVKSSLSEGTEFTLLIPMVMPGNSEVQTPPSDPEANPVTADMRSNSSAVNHPSPLSQDRRRATILVVEDNHDTMAFISGNLDQEYTVLRANDGVAGLAIATEAIPDLVVTDVMMPRMNGIEMTRRIRLDRYTSHIPVIMLTAKSSLESKIEGLEAKADDYIPKPFSMKELQTRITNLIDLRTALRRKYRDELNISPAEVTTNAIDEAFLTKAIQFVEQNMCREDFSIEQLYQELAMSRSLLHKKLKALTNQSASEFINDIRLRNAARLLKQKSGSISEIAYSIGYNSISYFNVSFKKKFGVTPTEYMG